MELNTGSEKKVVSRGRERGGSRQNEEEVNWYKTDEERMVNKFHVKTNDMGRDAV